MYKKIIRVIIGRQIQLTAPGMLGRKFDFYLGQSFLCQEWHLPGEPYEIEGVNLTKKPRDYWSFGTNTGSDLPLIFFAEDVKEVVIPNDPETIKSFKGAPFKVTIVEPCL